MTESNNRMGRPMQPAETEVSDQKKLLVIDDDRAIRGFVEHVMGRHGYEVLGVETAEEGEQHLNSGAFPVALVDINLPGMSGIELVRRFAGKTSLAIILFTGDDASYSYEQAIREGAVDFLLKPVRLEELAPRIERALEIRRTRMAHERLVAELERMAATDDLTGLFNRRRLTERLGDEVSRATRYNRPLSLLVIDLDRFKQLNDRFGHAVGDVALRGLADLLRADVRTTDQAFRYGGEEFVVLLPEIQLPEAAALAERLRREIEAFRLEHYPQCEMTVSIGVTECARGESPALLLERADKAMYSAKQAGRNQVVSTPPVRVGSPGDVAHVGASVLVIDDDLSICRMVESILTRHGYRVRTEATAADGLRAANEESADVLFIDLKLPDASGASVIHELKGRYDLNQMIIITALPELLDTPELLDLGPIRLLKKPLVAEQMIACLEAVRQSGQSADRRGSRAAGTVRDTT